MPKSGKRSKYKPSPRGLVKEAQGPINPRPNPILKDLAQLLGTPPLEDKPEGANSIQVGGNHYKKRGVLEPWDISVINGYDLFQHNILRYIHRWYAKNGIEDLEKAGHYLQKYIELARLGYTPSTPPEDQAEELMQAILGLYQDR